MPFLPNFAEIKGFANTLNPLNVFADSASNPPPASPSTASAGPSLSSRLGAAVAGPGPSTQAAAQNRSSNLNVPSPTERAIRPSLKQAAVSSSSSLDEDAGRRRSSGTSVVIVDPTGDDRAARRLDEAKRRPRPLSVGPGSFVAEPRRRKKPTMDTYIVVRPPPTSSKNPLNLQIQLVVKETKARERSVSGVSLRSSSTGTDVTSISAPVTPVSATIDLPSTDPAQQAIEISSPNASPPLPESPAGTSPDEPINKSSGAPLARSGSLKSNLSTATASTSGTRKRVEPMFNLAVHNVMHSTVVTDAATDAKVAKFLKRSLDVNGVGVLEPAEVWLPPSNLSSTANLAPTASNDETHAGSRSRPVSMVSLTTSLSPTATRLSETGTVGNKRNSVDMSSFKRASVELKTLRNEVVTDGGAKKFFGKMFKKKGQPETTATPAPADARNSTMLANKRSLSPVPADNGDGPLLVVKPPNMAPSSSDFEQTIHSHGHPTFGTAPVVIHRRSSGTIVTPEGAVTGLTAPSTSAASSNLGPSPSKASLGDQCTTLPMLPSSRPVGYTWSVKRWAKKNSEGWGAHLVAAAAAGLELVNGSFNGDGDDEVVFEWVKLRVPSNAVGSSIMRRYSNTGAIGPAPGGRVLKGRKPKSRAASIQGDSPPTEPTSSKNTLTVGTPDVAPLSLPPSPNLNAGIDPRPEPVRRVSASVSPTRRSASSPPSIAGSDDHDASSVHTHDMTAEEDSDPEDSETPWTCSVWVKNTGQRQLLGTLTPAPHHPKVIAALKIPRTLDSVSLTETKPSSTPAQAAMATRVKEEVCLTEENLKDVVCVTAMWLVAREEFGGLGRKKRSTRT